MTTTTNHPSASSHEGAASRESTASHPNATQRTNESQDAAVRDMYAAYPYPAGPPALRSGYDVRHLLSRGRLSRTDTGAAQRRPRVLDAGCGRGAGLIGEACVQPHVDYLGIDLNTRALADVNERAHQRGLANVRTAEIDLETLEGLAVPDGGFDVIRSSGVIHHLADPKAALARLADTALALHGIITLMVYGREGRAPIGRVARAVQAATDAKAPMAERLVAARALCTAIADPHDRDCPFADAARVPDVEFVDRYLHPRERYFGLVELIEMVTAAGLVPLEMCDGEFWSPARWIADPAALATVERLPAIEQLAAVDAIARPARLEMLLCRPENGPRIAPSTADALAAPLLVNGEARFVVGTRLAPSGLRVESVQVARHGGEPAPLPAGPVSLAAWILSTTEGPFLGRELVAALTERGVPAVEAERTLGELLAADLVFAPHTCDLPEATGR